MNLSEIRNLLREEDILLTRSLGQTFMHDQNQLRKIVGLAKLAPDVANCCAIRRMFLARPLQQMQVNGGVLRGIHK